MQLPIQKKNRFCVVRYLQHDTEINQEMTPSFRWYRPGDFHINYPSSDVETGKQSDAKLICGKKK